MEGVIYYFLASCFGFVIGVAFCIFVDFVSVYKANQKAISEYKKGMKL